MKKILFSIMLLFCATAVMAQEELGFIPVSNAQELYDAVKSNRSSDGVTSFAKIKLTGDIYLSELPEGTVTLNNTFSGTIDGSYWEYDEEEGEVIQKGYTIYGGHRNELDKDSLRKCDYLFTYLRGATIKSVSFKFIRVTSDDRDYQGVIASQAWDSHFNLVAVENCYVFCDEDYAGAFVGRAENCIFEMVASSGSDVRVYGVGAGGLVGYSKKCQYIGSSTVYASSVWADGSNFRNHAWVGGFVGYSEQDKFISCINTAMVGANQNQVGGFVGESTSSDFYNCQNFGIVAHVFEGDFNEECKKEKARLRSLATDRSIQFTSGMSTAMVMGAVAYKLFYGAAGKALVHALWKIGASLVSSVYGVILVAVVIAVVVTVVAIQGDDETGGICGLANYGTFELCSNFAHTKCKDENGGGIVGLGYGVTINNCYNGGSIEYDDASMGGSIIGSALAGDNGKKSKVTNCCAAVAYHAIGNYEDLDPTSGNNYSIISDKTETSPYEMAVDEKTMHSGIVAYWLNEGVENRNLTEKPWRQKVTCDPTNPRDTIIDYVPCVDASHPLVRVSDLKPTRISSPKELIDFADRVNGGDQFAVAELTNDINMTGYKWTPIGKNEAGKHFRGIFDGRGYTIKGLKYDEGNKSAGLFGAVHAHADIRNVIVGEGSEITSVDAGAAGIVGSVNIKWKWGYVTIENCGNYADVNVNKHGGGILGRIEGDEGEGVKVFVNNCFNLGTITADNGNSGMICGYMKNLGVVRNCWSGGQLRIGEGHSTWPYSIDNPKNEGECLVGYDKTLDIQKCFVVSPQSNIDRFTEYPLQNGVTAVNNESMSIGEFTYMLNGYTNDVSKLLTWQQNLGTDPHPVLGRMGVYHTRTVNNQFGTACLPYPVKSDSKISYYTFKDAKMDGDIDLEFSYEENVIPSGTPVLFRVPEVKHLTADNLPVKIGFYNADEGFTNAAKDCTSTIWQMSGTFKQAVFENTYAKHIYYVSGDVIRNAKKTTIAPFRAYFVGISIEELKDPGTGLAKSIRFIIEDEDGSTTALESVANDLMPVHINSKAYSLMGTEVNSSYRGIVIRNGKKMIQNR